uniref:Uncharacterized protein n=1 Tax=Cucumis melo TaxID=3656 RepID=A0A9I9EHE2_CUCME
MHPRNPILLYTHVADPLPSSIPSANGAGIKGGRPLGNLRRLPKKMLHRPVPIPWFPIPNPRRLR